MLKRVLLVLASNVALFGGGCVMLKGAEVYESLAEGTNAAIAVLQVFGII